mgnify:CR=1 FL=1
MTANIAMSVLVLLRGFLSFPVIALLSALKYVLVLLRGFHDPSSAEISIYIIKES